MDRESVYTLSVFPEDRSQTAPDSRAAAQDELVRFIMDFQIESVFIYR
jgi:DNA replication licensing factor MCM5